MPGVSEPVRSSRPQARAPSIVANSIMSWQLSSISSPLTSVPPAASRAALSSARWVPTAVRINPNMCGPVLVQTSIERLGRIPTFEQTAGRGPTVAHLHLDVGGDRRGAARVGDHLQFVVGQRAAVHVGDALAEQAVIGHEPLRSDGSLAELAVAGVDR